MRRLNFLVTMSSVLAVMLMTSMTEWTTASTAAKPGADSMSKRPPPPTEVVLRPGGECASPSQAVPTPVTSAAVACAPVPLQLNQPITKLTSFGIPAVRPSASNSDPQTPNIRRADVEQYVASARLSTANLNSIGSAGVMDYRCGTVAEIQALIPHAPPLVDEPNLICAAAVQGSFLVHQPGGPALSGSRVYILFDAKTGNLLDEMVP